MTETLRLALLFALVPVVATAFGAVLGARFPGILRWRGFVLYFAAGVVFAVVGVEILPEVTHNANPSAIVAGFSLGAISMLAVKALSSRLGKREGDESVTAGTGGAAESASMMIAVAVDFLLDGLLLGIGFAVGAKIGVLLALAEGAEQIAVGLALVVSLVNDGHSPVKAAMRTSGLGLLVFVTAIVGASVLSKLTGFAMEALLSFGLAALLFLVTEELLEEAHEEPRTIIATAMFFVGFLIFMLIGILLG